MRRGRLIFGLHATLAVVIAALIFIGDVSHGRSGRLIVAVLGPAGALWVFRVFLLVIIAALILAIRSELRQQKRIDRIVRQRESLDRSVHNHLDPTA